MWKNVREVSVVDRQSANQKAPGLFDAKMTRKLALDNALELRFKTLRWGWRDVFDRSRSVAKSVVHGPLLPHGEETCIVACLLRQPVVMKVDIS